MRIRYVFLLIMFGQASFSQVTLSPFYGLFADGSPAATAAAICDGTQPTTVVGITSVTGKIWMDRNLGASRAAISSTDYQSYGCLYQWGRGNDGHASITWTSATEGTPVNGSTTTLATIDNPGHALFISTPTNPYDWRSDNNNTRWQGLNGTNNPCPSGYRIPTNAEFGQEITAYSITNTATAFTNGPDGGFKFVLAGYRFSYYAYLDGQGSFGYIWTSTISGINANHRAIDNGIVYDISENRGDGFSVRCLKD